MIKPPKLQRGDTVAVVSLSSGFGGEPFMRHRYDTGKQRLEQVFGLNVIEMPHTLTGIAYLDAHPEARAADLMQAFADPSIKGIFCMIGGDDTIRLLPYIDLDVIRQNPKVFLGYSDTTTNHFMLFKAGLTSFYGPSVLAEFAENLQMHDYTMEGVLHTLFTPCAPLPIPPSPVWTSEFLDWADPANSAIPRVMIPDTRGYTVLQGTGKATGPLLGGCLDVFPMLMPTPLWPAASEWQGKLLFLETSEECIAPSLFTILLRALAAAGVLGAVNGILLGKPMGEKYQGEYERILQKVVSQEVGRPELPILSNLNFGHNAPLCTLPYGTQAEIDCETASLTLLEAGVS